MLLIILYRDYISLGTSSVGECVNIIEKEMS